MEPEELARRLGISGKTLRAWLRRRYPRSPVDVGARWQLSPTQVAEATEHFTAKGRVATSPEGSGPPLTRKDAKATAALREKPETNDTASAARRSAARMYQPDPVSILLVAEAPPSAVDRYFYFEGVSEHDSLFRYVIRGLFGEAPDRSSKPAWLERLREAGVFLIDVAEEPSGAAALGDHVADLVERCRALSPERIVLIKATVYDAAFEALRKAELPVVDRRIPFPGSGQQLRFMVAFQQALADAGFRAGWAR